MGIVIGTAGHVDHGKTTFLRWLTGMEPSRLSSERERGMTMQLGYVWLETDDHGTVGVIDVPGHKDYRSVAAGGASVLDGFIFIVAADDGWMPQSEEHLWSLKSFGIKKGMAIITKTDLVSPERALEVAEDVELRIMDALDIECPVVDFSSKNLSSADKVKSLLFDLLESIPEQSTNNPQMYIDRVFQVEGRGSVVTGTLRGGKLREKDCLEIVGMGKKATIKEIQCYGKKVPAVVGTSRVALQLGADLSKDLLKKDVQLCIAGKVYRTLQIDLRVQLYPGVKIHPRKNTEVLLIHSGVRTKAKMIPIRKDGEQCVVRLQLSNSKNIKFSEKVLLQSSGAQGIIGSARVLDEAPIRGVQKAAQRLQQIEDYSIFEYLLCNIEKNGYLAMAHLKMATDFSSEETNLTLDGASEDFTVFGDFITSPQWLGEMNAKIILSIEGHHEVFPEQEGIAESKLLKILRIMPEVLKPIVQGLKKSGKILQKGPHLKLLSHVPKFDHSSKVVKKLLEISLDTEAKTWTLAELEIDSKKDRAQLRKFVTDSKILHLGEKYLISARAFEQIKASICGFMSQTSPATVADVRDHLGYGRKDVVLYLEQLDKLCLTSRNGNERSLL